MECRILKGRECEVTQEFKGVGIHQGIDIVGKGYTLDTVLAHSDGKVVWTQTGQRNNQGSTGNLSYGNCVKIQHTNGYYTLYAHLDRVDVSVGQTVSKGQAIGYMGNTGNSYGGHTHFEVRNTSDSIINPTEYLYKELLTNSGTDYTGVITYQAYTNEWLPEVNKCDDTDDGYAGIYGKFITGFRCKPEFGEIIYQAHIKGNNWLEEVNSKDYSNDGDNSYAGLYGSEIDCIKIKSTKGYVDYRVHTKEDGWLPFVDSRTESGTESYAGLYGHTIDGIQMK